MLDLVFVITLIILAVGAVVLGISVIFNCRLCSKIISVVMMILCLILIISMILRIMRGDIVLL